MTFNVTAQSGGVNLTSAQTQLALYAVRDLMAALHTLGGRSVPDGFGPSARPTHQFRRRNQNLCVATTIVTIGSGRTHRHDRSSHDPTLLDKLDPTHPRKP